MRKYTILLVLLFIGFIQLYAQDTRSITEVGGNLGETFTNIFELISPSKIISIIVVLILLSLTLNALNWVFNWASKKFNRHRLKIRRIQPILHVGLWTITVVALVKASVSKNA